MSIHGSTGCVQGKKASATPWTSAVCASSRNGMLAPGVSGGHDLGGAAGLLRPPFPMTGAT